MNVFESRRTRRLLVRLDRGEELVDRVEALSRREGIKAAWVRGVGALEWVELDRHDQARREPEPASRFDTPGELLGLEGSISIAGGMPRAVLHAALARRTDNGVSVVGGRLRAARVFAVELSIEVFEDLELHRAMDASTGLLTWLGAGDAARDAEPEAVRSAQLRSQPWRAPQALQTRPREVREELSLPGASALSAPTQAGSRPLRQERREEPPASRWIQAEDEDESDAGEAEVPAGGGGAVSWADVAAISAAPVVDERPGAREARANLPRPKLAAAVDHGDEATSMPQRGDWVDHRQFGVCRVERQDDDGGLLIRLPSGARKTIKLDFLEVGRPREEANRRVFPLRLRTR